MILYLVLKIFDLSNRNVWNLVFAGNLEANLFLVELVLGVIVPILIVFSGMSASRSGLFIYGLLVSSGVILNRMNVVFTGMSGSTAGSYFPSIWEWSVSIGLIAIGVLAYCFIVENFRILGHDDHHTA
ncbi:hypothetical protein P378_10250 [Desulforamulus profundi]|uniref:Uncharacterized protein n=1 Tax=Desulforamulus profundi TaxID=1383067 RepID=A0A2C6MFL3_9FIRM|nr:hypothetical protein P378_10250 [Desulforamulus profundi]